MQKYTLPYVVVFIPAHNEEGSIGKVIDMIKNKYQKSPNLNYVLDVVVVDDGSRDRTSQIAKEMGVRKVVSHPANYGLGAATRTGMQTAYELGANIAVKIDADFQHDPGDIEKVIRPILDDRADCVFGSRFMGGLEYKMPLHRAWGNKFFSWLTGKLTGLKVTDGQTGLMAFNRRYLEIFNIPKDYNETQQLIIDAWGKKMRIMEVPVVFHKRTTGKSFISWKYPFRVLPNMLRMYIHFRPIKFYTTIGLLFILLGVATGVLILTANIRFIGDATVSILIIVGVQIIFFGLLADQISKKRTL